MGYPYSYQTPYQQNYFPVGYQPMYQQGYQQPAQQTQPQQSFAPNPSGILWVSGLMEAQAYPLAPNSAVALWEKSGKTIFLKQADATGKPSMTVYDLVERTETPQDGGNSVDSKVPAYATKDELGAVVGVVKDYSEALNSIKADIENLKTDMYGVAGKRKATRKATEAAEDDE